uniref:Putative secreted protein n=1 Tax=Anopheles marajoara TaxID=58244 RepID=A0A2M4C6Y0_9DIPT
MVVGNGGGGGAVAAAAAAAASCATNSRQWHWRRCLGLWLRLGRWWKDLALDDGQVLVVADGQRPVRRRRDRPTYVRTHRRLLRAGGYRAPVRLCQCRQFLGRWLRLWLRLRLRLRLRLCLWLREGVQQQ